MKICPVCKLQAHLNATQCAQCGHVYRTQFTHSQTQPVQPPPVSSVPPAPQPPPPMQHWWDGFNPAKAAKHQADMIRYQAELGVYMSQNGLIPNEFKRRMVFFGSVIGVIAVLFAIWMFYDQVRFSQKLDAEIERNMRTTLTPIWP